MNIPANLQCAFARHEHPYLMWDGILKIPDAIEDVTKKIDIEKIQKTIHNRKKFYLIGCGTSLFASQIAAYTFQSLSNATAVAVDAFEFSAYPPNDLEESILVCVSHTGGTPGVYASAKLAKSRNVPVICVTDRANSKLEELSDLCLLSNMGLEPSLPKTWSFVASLLRLMSIAIASSQAEGKDNQSNIQLLRSLGDKNRKWMRDIEAEIKVAVEKLSSVDFFTIAGGGPLSGIANEMSLKLTEAALVKSISWEIEEAAHGLWASTGENDLVTIFAVNGPSFSSALKLANGIKKTGAKVWVITDQPDKFQGADLMTKLPDTEPEWLIPIFSILPAYIFTYYLAISKGINPDIMRMNDERYLEARGMMRKSIE